jgi:hypothetical protein
MAVGTHEWCDSKRWKGLEWWKVLKAQPAVRASRWMPKGNSGIEAGGAASVYTESLLRAYSQISDRVLHKEGVPAIE